MANRIITQVHGADVKNRFMGRGFVLSLGGIDGGGGVKT